MVFHRLIYFVARVLIFLKLKVSPYYKNPIAKCLFTLSRKYRKKYSPQTELLSDKVVMIALTHQCQCRCLHCGVTLNKQDKKDELRSHEIMKLIDESIDLGVSRVYFFGGEPLLVPELTDLIRYAKKKNMMVKLDTNGFLLDEAMVKKLKDSGLDFIGVSIDSSFEAVHDKCCLSCF